MKGQVGLPLSALHELNPIIPIIAQELGNQYYSHFADYKTGMQKDLPKTFLLSQKNASEYLKFDCVCGIHFIPSQIEHRHHGKAVQLCPLTSSLYSGPIQWKLLNFSGRRVGGSVMVEVGLQRGGWEPGGLAAFT